MILRLLLTFLVAVLCGFILLKLKVPGGMLVGAIIGVVTLNISTGLAYMPYAGKFAAQATAGAFIGCMVERGDILRLKTLVKPTLVMLTGMLITNISLGFLLTFISPMGLLTSMMSALPAGISDAPLIVADMGGNPGQVVVMQFTRLAFGIMMFPSLIAVYARRFMSKQTVPESAQDAPVPQEPQQAVVDKAKGLRSFLCTSGVSVIGGLVGYWVDIPAGVLVFSLAATVVFKMMIGPTLMPMLFRRGAQALSGSFIGCSIGLADVLVLWQLIIPAMVLLLGFLINCFITGKLLHKWFGIDLREAFLTATPAGALDMALISADLGVKSADIVVMQIFRIIASVVVFPQIVLLIARLVS